MVVSYLLDTNVLSEVLRPAPNPTLIERLLTVGEEAAMAAPVWHELRYGCDRLPAGRRRRAVEAFLADLEKAHAVLPYDDRAARWHAHERARLTKARRPPPFVDGQIAAIAATCNLTLVTRNVRDFGQFRGITVESWFG